MLTNTGAAGSRSRGLKRWRLPGLYLRLPGLTCTSTSTDFVPDAIPSLDTHGAILLPYRVTYMSFVPLRCCSDYSSSDLPPPPRRRLPLVFRYTIILCPSSMMASSVLYGLLVYLATISTNINAAPTSLTSQLPFSKHCGEEAMMSSQLL